MAVISGHNSAGLSAKGGRPRTKPRPSACSVQHDQGVVGRTRLLCPAPAGEGRGTHVNEALRNVKRILILQGQVYSRSFIVNLT